MNLADFFVAPSLERGSPHEQQRSLLLRMPPRSKDGGPTTPPYELIDMLGAGAAPYNLQQLQLQPQLERIDPREKNRRDSMGSSAAVARPAADVTLYVGRNRAPYTLTADSLKHSTYFASLLEKQQQRGGAEPMPPIVLDCDEGIFQHMLLILRYGSFEALPKMLDSELFRLKRELECYGIDVPDSAPRKPSPPSAPSTPSSSLRSHHSQQQLPQSPVSQHQTQQLHHHRHHSHATASVGDFPDLPDELKDSSKLVLVARMDDDARGRCECTPREQHSHWALSFHYRHTFCTGCGKCPSAPAMPPRLLAEMYMAAAMYYSSESFSNKQRWSVGCDSTCSLKLMHARPCCSCPCAGAAATPMPTTVWAVSTYHSHAFCTHCGQAADERTLICILLTLRYGGVSRHSRPRGRDRVAGAHSEGVIAQSSSSSRLSTTSSPRSEPPSHHSRGNRSL